MAQSANLVQGGFDRLQSAVDQLDRQVRKVQKDLRSRARDVEKRFDRERKRFEARARRGADRARAELRGTPVIQRADAFRKDVSKRLERGVEDVLGTLGVASQADLRRIDRKLGQLNRKLRELEKASERRRESQPAA